MNNNDFHNVRYSHSKKNFCSIYYISIHVPCATYIVSVEIIPTTLESMAEQTTIAEVGKLYKNLKAMDNMI